MFLTNNMWTRDNLLIYSKWKYISRILPKSCNGEEYIIYEWAIDIENNWDNILKNTSSDYPLDNSTKPYGNIKKCVTLIKKCPSGILVLQDEEGNECF